jgi:3-dehydroquinate synthase
MMQRHSSPRIIPVQLGTRSYQIHVGRNLLAEAGALLAPFSNGRRMLILCDENLASLHLAALKAALGGEDRRDIPTLVLPAGEKTKSWPALEQVVETMITHRLERNDLLIAFGGGVIGDLGGFGAAISRRGTNFVQIPTSLLAQVDSSVGGKTGINSPNGKNLIGAFHQPVLVLADTALLDTLPQRELRAGYAEIVKYGLIDQPDFFEWLEKGAWRGVLDGDGAREEAIAFSCAAKARIVARDETETGDRALLNLGHTFGHALEALVGYDPARLVHGEGVAIGLAMAHRFSQKLGLCSQELASRVSAHLVAVGLPTRLADVPGGTGSAEAILTAIRHDKKVSQGALTFILTRGLGQSFIAKGIEAEDVLAFLREELALEHFR